MAVAALGAGIMASTGEIARLMNRSSLGTVVHQGVEGGVFLARFAMPDGTWIGLVVFGSDTSIGLVQLFFGRLTQGLVAAVPSSRGRAPILAEQFEEELNASLRTLFGR
jgi:hypothetical protein